MMFGRSSKPKSLAEIPRRWDAAQRPVADLPSGPASPSKLITSAIVMLCLLMTGAIVLLWKSGGLVPTEAAAAPETPKAANYEAMTASLDAARALMTRSQWAKAETVLRQAAMKFPEEQEIRLALAETLLARDRLADSYDQYVKALAIDPSDPKIQFAAGQVASKAGFTERAEEHFSMAQGADRTNPAYPLMLGMVQRKLGNVEAAKASLLRAANLDPENAFSWGAMADIALSENKVDLALQHVDRARRLQPESKDWRLIEARARKRKGEADKALMLLVPMDPSQRRELPVVRLIAECYGMLGKPVDAANAYADAFEADAANAELAYEAAGAFERAGNRTKAIEYANLAKSLGHPDAANLLGRLSR